MKYQILLTVFFLISIFVSAQDTSSERVEENRIKINELSKRINTLMDTLDASTSAKINVFEYNRLKDNNLLLEDSIEILQQKIDLLNKDLGHINAEGRQNEFYIVVSSVRTSNGIEVEKNKLKQTFDSLSIVRNQTQSWYHLILPEVLGKAGAVKEVDKLRNGTVQDAWFIGRKEIIVDLDSQSGNSL